MHAFKKIVLAVVLSQSNEQFQNIVVTVSEKRADALGFFKHKNFEVVSN